jgi:polyisoprenoid-binding protein YceI
MKTFSLIPLAFSILLLCAGHGRKPSTATFRVDAKQSKMVWTGYPLFSFGEHYGSIDITSGEIRVEGEAIASGRFDIDMKSIRTLDMKDDDGGESLSNHLKSDDFFSVDKFPVALFEITKAEKIKDAVPGQPNYELSGALTVKGIKNGLKFPAVVSVQDNKLVAHAKFKFDRTRWDIRYNSGRFFDDIGDGAISDAVGIEISLVAIK